MKKGLLKNSLRVVSNRFAQLYYFGKHYIHGAKLNMSIEEARSNLESYSPNPNTSSYRKDTPVRGGRNMTVLSLSQHITVPSILSAV